MKPLTAIFSVMWRPKSGSRIVNWDAHTDVRPLVAEGGHSGSPFRQALEHGSRLCAGYTVLGALPWCVAEAHRELVEQHGGDVVFRDAVVEVCARGSFERAVTASSAEAVFVSFDLDAIEGALAPGVSAPGVGGLPVELWLRAAETCGRDSRVTSVDVVELNPRNDRHDVTARLAALTVWSFLAGLAER